jgi:hypothetical protein
MSRRRIPTAALAPDDRPGGAEQRGGNGARIPGARQQGRLPGRDQPLRCVGAKGRARLVASEGAEVAAVKEALIA